MIECGLPAARSNILGDDWEGGLEDVKAGRMPKGSVLEAAEPPVTMFGAVPPTCLVCPVCPPTETGVPNVPTFDSAAAPWLGMEDGKQLQRFLFADGGLGGACHHQHREPPE